MIDSARIVSINPSTKVETLGGLMLILAFAFLLLSLLLSRVNYNFALAVWSTIAVGMLVRGFRLVFQRKFRADVVFTNIVGFASLGNAFVGWMDHYGPSAGVPHDSSWNFYMEGFSVIIAFYAVMMTEAWHKIHRRDVSLRSAFGLCFLAATAGISAFLCMQLGHPLVFFFGGTLALIPAEYIRKSAPLTDR